MNESLMHERRVLGRMEGVMRGIGIVLAALVVIGAAVFAFYFFDVDVEDAGELPEVSIEGGRAPEASIEAGDIDVGRRTVEVPEIDVDSPEEDAREGAN